MTTYDSKDPWDTGGRTGYMPPPVALRVKPQKQLDFGRLVRTVFVVVAMLWAFNYVWQNYYLTGR